MSELTLPAILKQAIKSELDNVHTAIPGVITAYDFNTKKASVQPTIKRVFANGIKLKMPVITGVPVIWPGTSKAGFHCGITPGKDGCLIICSERSLENWLSGDPTNPEIEPGDPRQFSLSDAICIPGLFSLNSPGKVANTGKGVEIVNGNDSINLTDDGDVEILGNTKNFVTHAELDLALTTLMTKLNSHTHVVASIGSPTGPASASVPPITFSIDISAAKTEHVKTK